MSTAPCYAMSPVMHRPGQHKIEKYGGAAPEPPLCIVPDITRPEKYGGAAPEPPRAASQALPGPALRGPLAAGASCGQLSQQRVNLIVTKIEK